MVKRSEIAPANQSRLSFASAGEEQFHAFCIATWRAGQSERLYQIAESKAVWSCGDVDIVVAGVGPDDACDDIL